MHTYQAWGDNSAALAIKMTHVSGQILTAKRSCGCCQYTYLGTVHDGMATV